MTVLGYEDPVDPSPRLVAGELLRLIVCLLATFIVITALALLLAAADVSEPGRAARKLMVPLFVVIYVIALNTGFKGLLVASTLAPRPPHALRQVLLGFAAGKKALLQA